MEIGRVNPTMSAAVADKSYGFALKRTASADSGVSAERSDSSIAPMDVARLENVMAEADSGGDATTEEFLQKLIERVNTRLAGGIREFNYSRHEKTGQLMIKILDHDTKEVIREIPPEKTLDAVARMWDMMGIFVDNKT
jgi:flagellar protein FlaG